MAFNLTSSPSFAESMLSQTITSAFSAASPSHGHHMSEAEAEAFSKAEQMNSGGRGPTGVTVDSTMVTNCPRYSADGRLFGVERLRLDAKPPMPAWCEDLVKVSEHHRTAFEDDEEDYPWSLPPEPNEEDLMLASTYSMKGASQRLTPSSERLRHTFAQPYRSPLAGIDVAAATNKCVLHLVKYNRDVPPDFGRIRLARWVARHPERLSWAWWANASTPALLEAGMLELLDALDPTGCAAALASHVQGNPQSVTKSGASRSTGDASKEGDCDDEDSDAALSGSHTAPRQGLPVLQAAVELSPHRLKTTLLVLDGCNSDTLETLFRGSPPRFGMHIVAFCDDNFELPSDNVLRQLVDVREIALDFQDSEQRELFTRWHLIWLGVHLTHESEFAIRAERAERDKHNEEKRQKLRSDPITFRTLGKSFRPGASTYKSPSLSESTNGHHLSPPQDASASTRQPLSPGGRMPPTPAAKAAAAESAANDEGEILELEDADFDLLARENELSDQVSQLQRLARTLHHSPSLLELAHKFIAQVGIHDLHPFVREVAANCEAIEAWQHSREVRFDGEREAIDSARRWWAAACPDDSSEPQSAVRSRSDSVTAPPALRLAQSGTSGSFAAGGNSQPTTPTGRAGGEATLSPTRGGAGRNLPPRRRSRQPSVVFSTEALIRRASTITDIANLSDSAVSALTQRGVPNLSDRRDPIGTLRMRTAAYGAALLSVMTKYVSNKPPEDVSRPPPTDFANNGIGHTESLISFHGNTSTTSIQTAPWTQEDAALVMISLALPRAFPASVFGANVVERLVTLGFWNRMGNETVLVSREILGGLEVLCRLLDATSPVKVGSGNRNDALIGGSMPSACEHTFSLATSWLTASQTTKSRDRVWHRWRRPLTTFLVGEANRRALYLPELPSLKLPPRTAPHDLTSLPSLDPDPGTWTSKEIPRLVSILPDLENRRRHEDIATVFERCLAVCITTLQHRLAALNRKSGKGRGKSFARAKSQTTGAAAVGGSVARLLSFKSDAGSMPGEAGGAAVPGDTVSTPLGTLAAIYALFKELSTVYVEASMAGVAEKFAERAHQLARAVSGDRKDTPAMAESLFLLGRAQVRLGESETERGAAAQRADILGSDVGSNMQLTAYLRADVERKQYIVEAAKFFTEAVERWSAVPDSAIGDELALCHRTISAAMTHELRDRESLKFARNALDNAAASRTTDVAPEHQTPAEPTNVIALRDSIDWARNKIGDFLGAIERGAYEEATSLLEGSLALAYLGELRPSAHQTDFVIAAGRLGGSLAEQLRPVPTFHPHLHSYVSFSETELAKHHGTNWLSPTTSAAEGDDDHGKMLQGGKPRTHRIGSLGRKKSVLFVAGATSVTSHSSRHIGGDLTSVVSDSSLGDGDDRVSALSSDEGALTHQPSAGFGVARGARSLVPKKSEATNLHALQPRRVGTLRRANNSLVRAEVEKYGVQHAYAAHVLLETCDPSDVRALDLLAKMLDAGLDPRTCSPHNMESLLHVAARRNLVLFIGLLLAHPLVSVEYVPAYRLNARRDGLSTIADVHKLPPNMPCALEITSVPLTVELLLLKGATPLPTFRRFRTLCVRRIVSMPTRLPKLFEVGTGPFNGEVRGVLTETELTVPERCAVAPFVSLGDLFSCLDEAAAPELAQELCKRLKSAHETEIDVLADAATAITDDDLTQLLKHTKAAASATTTKYTRDVTGRLAVVLTRLVRARRCDCAQAVIDALDISPDVMHWEDAAEYRRDRRDRAMEASAVENDAEDDDLAASDHRRKKPAVTPEMQSYITAFADLHRRIEASEGNTSLF